MTASDRFVALRLWNAAVACERCGWRLLALRLAQTAGMLLECDIAAPVSVGCGGVR